MQNQYLEFYCSNCEDTISEEDIISEHDLWESEGMEDLTEDEQANIVRQHATCPNCEDKLTEVGN